MSKVNPNSSFDTTKGRSSETLSGVYLLCHALSELTTSDAILSNVSYSSSTKAKFKIKCETNNSINKIQITNKMNELIKENIEFKSVEVAKTNKPLPFGVVSSNDNSLFEIFANNKSIGFSGITLIQNCVELKGIKFLKFSQKKNKNMFEGFMEVGIELKNEKSNIKIKKFGSESQVLVTTNTIVSDILKHLKVKGIITNEVLLNKKLINELNSKTETTVNQFQSLTYTRGLFAGNNNCNV